MAGQTNSWMGKIQISPVPCIGDTVRKRSSTNQDFDSSGNNFGDTNVSGEESPVSASLWWLIVAGLAIGLLYKGNKKQRQS